MFKEIRNYIIDDKFKVYLTKNEVNIINYYKIITIEKNIISLSYSDGTLIIKGNDLSLKKMLDNEILVSGVVKAIELG